MNQVSKFAVAMSASLLVLIVTVAFTIMMDFTGVFVLPMDDPYIHLEIAKNFAHSGIPAINTGEIGFGTSSYFWTFLLAVAELMGLQGPIIPVLLSGFFAVMILVVASRLLHDASHAQRLLTLSALLLGTTMPLQVMIGMEHTAHAFAALLAWTIGERTIRNASPQRLLILAGLLALTTLIRFETFFISAPICLGLLYKRKIVGAVGVGLVSITPISVIGLLSLTQGGQFLPNSVLLRSPMAQVVGVSSGDAVWHFLQSTFTKMLSAPELTALLILVSIACIFALKNKVSKESLGFPVLVVSTGCLHLVAAQVGWFYRYQFYLMVGLIVAFSLLVLEISKTGALFAFKQNLQPKDRKLLIVLAVIMALGLADRTWQTTTAGIQAGRELFLQPFQLATFIREFVPGETVAVHDLGAAVFYTENRVIDMVGLGHNRIAQASFDGYATAEFFQDLVLDEGVTILFLYDEWLPEGTASKWSELAIYSSPRTISEVPLLKIYATHESDVPRLTALLCAFRAKLPAEVDLRIACERP